MVNNSSPQSYEDLFNDQFSYYLVMGMTYEQFWDGKPDLVISYRKAEEIRNKRRNEDKYIQGLYFYEALCDVACIFNPLSKEHKPRPYPKEPYDFAGVKHKETEEEKNQRKLRELREELIRRSTKNA